MRGWKGIVLVAAMSAAYGWPARAEANGEHLAMGGIHFDPLVGGGVAVFLGLVTFMFVAQWVRFNAARRRAAESAGSEEMLENGEEVANDIGQQDDE